MTKHKTRFHEEWYSVYGYEMPPHVERLPIGDIQQAIEFGRKKHRPVCETSGSDESMMEFDTHKQH